MQISETGYLRIKVIAGFTLALFCVVLTLFVMVYRTYGFNLFRYQPGWLTPFLVLYIVQFPIVFGGQIGANALLPKVSAFCFVYVTYFCYVVYKLRHPVNGLPTGLLAFGTLMLLLMPVIYFVGWGVGQMLFMIRTKGKSV